MIDVFVSLLDCLRDTFTDDVIMHTRMKETSRLSTGLLNLPVLTVVQLLFEVCMPLTYVTSTDKTPLVILINSKKIQQKNYLVVDVREREISLTARGWAKNTHCLDGAVSWSRCPNTTRSNERTAEIY